jgi:hypothetical protein
LQRLHAAFVHVQAVFHTANVRLDKSEFHSSCKLRKSLA